jgi:hypothetical protein
MEHRWGRRVCKVLVGKPEGKTALGRPRCTWEDNNNMDRKQYGRARMDLSGLGYGPVANCCEHCSEPLDLIGCWEFLE